MKTTKWLLKLGRMYFASPAATMEETTAGYEDAKL